MTKLLELPRVDNCSTGGEGRITGDSPGRDRKLETRVVRP